MKTRRERLARRGSAAEGLMLQGSSRQPAFAFQQRHLMWKGEELARSLLCEEERRLRRLIISKFNPYPPLTGPQAAGSRPKQKVSH
jgi:hypothetical protein